MGIGTFRCAGATGQAPTTEWMSLVADKYTMLLKYDDRGGAYSGVINDTAVVPCLYTNRFNNNNLSLGAFITAPDGTANTCQKLVEDNSNTEHYIQAGFNFFRPMWPALRIAGIWKAGERTRVCYRLCGRNFPGLDEALYLGFDLAGGQIAYQTFGSYVGPPATTSTWQIQDQTITSLGSGFYLCVADVLALHPNAGGIGIDFNLHTLIDNGSGTAAKSLTYAGDGSSGLYGWKHSVLPKRAWGINGTAFFDDFNDPTLANIDLNNTQAPGFDWYVQAGTWGGSGTIVGPGWFVSYPMPSSSLSASGSILTIAPNAPPNVGCGPGIVTFCNPGAGLDMSVPAYPPGVNPTGPGVGKGWKPPFLIEISYGYDEANAEWRSCPIPYMASVEWSNWAVQSLPYSLGNAGAAKGAGGEYDVWDHSNQYYGADTGGGAYSLNIGGTFFSTISSVTSGTVKCFWGYPEFFANRATSFGYNQNHVVHSGGVFYRCIVGNTAQAPPGADWAVFSYPADSLSTGNPSPPFVTDFSQQHLYSQIVLPYDRATGDYGCYLRFFDGGFARGDSWTTELNLSGDNASINMHTWDWHHAFLILVDSSASGHTSQASYYGYVRVSQ